MESYIYNNNITIVGGTDQDTFTEQQNLADVIQPKADFYPEKKKD